MEDPRGPGPYFEDVFRVIAHELPQADSRIEGPDRVPVFKVDEDGVAAAAAVNRKDDPLPCFAVSVNEPVDHPGVRGRLVAEEKKDRPRVTRNGLQSPLYR